MISMICRLSESRMHFALFSVSGLYNLYSPVDDGESCRHFLLRSVIGGCTCAGTASSQVAIVWISFIVVAVSTVDNNVVLSVFRKIFGAGRHSAFDFEGAVCIARKKRFPAKPQDSDINIRILDSKHG
jgi:hypothetical protein